MRTKTSIAALALAWALVFAASCGGSGDGGMLEECGNSAVEGMEQCDDGSTVPCDGCSASCTTETGYICGDGLLNQACGEQCDDGNTTPGDGCDAACLLEGCGNGVLDAGEECDDGDRLPCDGCSASCTNETGYICGDGLLNQTCGEQCDDGNTTPGDGCDAACLLEDCGNGVLDAGEECDDGDQLPCDGCSASCTNETGYICGDGLLNQTCGEQCDDGNTTPGDGCDAACLLEGCGNGVLDAGEECDDGDRLPCDGCSASCTNETGYICGDGLLNQTCGEQCDDGNTTPGDGCDAACQIETGPLLIDGDYAIDIDTTLDTCEFGSGSLSSPMNVDGRSETQFTVAIPVGGTGDDCNRLEFMREANVLTRIGSSPGDIGSCGVQIDVTTTLEFFADDTVTGSEIYQLSATGGDCSGLDLPCAVELVLTGLRCTGCFDCVEGPVGQSQSPPGLLGDALGDALDAAPERLRRLRRR